MFKKRKAEALAMHLQNRGCVWDRWYLQPWAWLWSELERHRLGPGRLLAQQLVTWVGPWAALGVLVGGWAGAEAGGNGRGSAHGGDAPGRAGAVVPARGAGRGGGAPMSGLFSTCDSDDRRS